LLKKILEPRARGYLRLAGGNFQESESQIRFDDAEALGWRFQPPELKEVIIYHSANQNIYGIQGVYEVDSDRLEGTTEGRQRICLGPLNYS
jgi:hypothetical protein